MAKKQTNSSEKEERKVKYHDAFKPNIEQKSDAVRSQQYVKKKLPEKIELTQEQVWDLKRPKYVLYDTKEKPSSDTRTSAQRNADYWDPIKGASERAKTQMDNGKHPIQGLAKTVGTSALIATGALELPALATWGGLGSRVLVGGAQGLGYGNIGMGTGNAVDDFTYGAAGEVGIPAVGKMLNTAYKKSIPYLKVMKNIPKNISKNIKRYNEIKKFRNSESDTEYYIRHQTYRDYQKTKYDMDQLEKDVKYYKQPLIDGLNSKITDHMKFPDSYPINILDIRDQPLAIIKQAKKENLLKSKGIFSFDDGITYPVYGNVNGKVPIKQYLRNPYGEGAWNVNIDANGLVSQAGPEELSYAKNKFVGKKLKQIVRENVSHLETKYPNSKVIGSPALIDTKGFNRLPNDYDLTTLNFSDVSGFDEIGYKARYGKTFNYKGQEIDVNLATDPEYARDLSKYLESQGFNKTEGESDIFHVNKYFDKLNPTQKTLFDKAQSSKSKHFREFNRLLLHGDGKEILHAIKSRNAVLFKDLKLPQLDFQDVDANIRILQSLGLHENADILAKDPDKMMAIVLDKYVKETSYGRGVDNSAPLESLYQYSNTSPGEEAYGLGRYSTVGNSGHLNGAYGYINDYLPNNTTTEKFVEKLIDSRKNKELNNQEIKRIKELFKKHDLTYNGETRISEILGDKSKRNMKDAKSFLNEFADIVGQTGYYPGSEYGKGKLYLGLKDVKKPIINYDKMSRNIKDGDFLSNRVIGSEIIVPETNIGDELLNIIREAHVKVPHRFNTPFNKQQYLEQFQRNNMHQNTLNQYKQNLSDLNERFIKINHNIDQHKAAYISPISPAEHNYREKINALSYKYDKMKGPASAAAALAAGVVAGGIGISGGLKYMDIMSKNSQRNQNDKKKITAKINFDEKK